MPPYRGIFPIAPTPFTVDGELDLASQRRVVDYLIDAGVDKDYRGREKASDHSGNTHGFSNSLSRHNVAYQCES